MATTVTLTTTAPPTVTVKPSKSTVASITVAPSSNLSLGSLNNVDVSNTSNGKTLIFNSATNKFEADDVFVAGMNGGTF